MKTALYITDCSDGSARRLRQWISSEANEPLRLTVVHPYDIEEGLPLTKSTFHPIKAAAQSRLNNWSADLAGNLTTETVLATPELALTIYLLIRSYTYWLVDDPALLAQVSGILALSTTEPYFLDAQNQDYRSSPAHCF